MRRSRGCQVHISCRCSPTEVRVSRKARAEHLNAAEITASDFAALRPLVGRGSADLARRSAFL